MWKINETDQISNLTSKFSEFHIAKLLTTHLNIQSANSAGSPETSVIQILLYRPALIISWRSGGYIQVLVATLAMLSAFIYRDDNIGQ